MKLDTGTSEVRPSQTVLIVSTNADRAGAPTHVRDLVMALKERFRFVVVFGENGPIRDFLAERGIETHVAPGLRSAVSPLKDLRVIAELRARIRALRPDLIHVHSSKASLVGRIAGFLEHVPVVYTVHGWGFGAGRPALQSVMVWASERLTRGMVAKYLAVSEADDRDGRRALGLKADRIQAVPNAVIDDAPRADPRSAGSFIMVARADIAKDHQKDHRTALRAFSRVRTSMRFSFVGGGTDDPAFIRLARDWAGPATDRIELLGARSDIGSLLASSSVFVLASRYEGLPLSILEAMRSGLPIIASDVGGVPELVVDGVTGRLVPPEDPDALAAAMQELADDPALRARMGQAGRDRFEAQFSMDRLRDRVTAVYDALSLNSPTSIAKLHTS